MTDKEKLQSLFSEFGIGYFSDDDAQIDVMYGETSHAVFLENPIAGRNEKIDGYGGFYARFNFDDDGKFVNVGLFE